jgi:hypothetical protein
MDIIGNGNRTDAIASPSAKNSIDEINVEGATTLGIMTLGIMTLRIKTFRTMALNDHCKLC